MHLLLANCKPLRVAVFIPGSADCFQLHCPVYLAYLFMTALKHVIQVLQGITVFCNSHCKSYHFGGPTNW